MTFNEIIAVMAEKLGIQGLEPADGVASLEVDGMTVSFIEDRMHDSMMLLGGIGEPPPEGAERFAEMMLEANFLFHGTSGATLSCNPQTKEFSLAQSLPLSGMDGDAVMSALENFTNTLERWRKLLADFRPIAAESAGTGESPEDPLSNSFLSV